MPSTAAAGPRPRRLHSKIAMTVALLAAVSAGALGWALHSGSPHESLVFLWVPLIGAATYFRGRAAGIGTGIVGLLAALYFIIPPVNSFAIKPDALPVVLSFALVGALVVEGAARLRVAEADAYRFTALVESSDRQQRFLVDANQVLASSLDVQATLDALARLAVPALADWCTIEIVADGGNLTHVTVMHQDPAQAALAREAQQTYALRPDAQSPSVVGTGQSAVYPDVSEELLALLVPDPALRGIIGGRGIRSVLAAPLVARGRTLGALLFFSVESARRYDHRDLTFAEQLAHQAALAIDNARLLQTEQAARLDAERVASRVGRLQGLTAALSEALTPDQVAEVILRHVVDDLGAAAAAVLQRGDDGRSLQLLSAVGYSANVLSRWRDTPGEIQPIAAAMRTGRVVWFASWTEFQARYPETLMPSEPARLGARAAVPLVLHGRRLGALYMNFAEARELAGEEIEFMLTLGRQCAQALDRARLFAREHQIATTLQHALLPVELPRVPGIEIEATYLPAAAAADVGGDWYDVFQLPDGRVVLSVGDVVGHGLEAAATMGEVQHAIRTAVLEGHDPGKALAVASRVLQLRGDTGMATAVVAVLDPVARELTYAAGGHPAPIIATNERIETLEAGGSPPLGLMEAPAARAARVSLPAGALLVLYTDGLIEHDRDYLSGEAALWRAVQHEQAARSVNPAQSILERIVPGKRVRDDIAILTVRLEHQPAEPLDITLPAEVASLARTRHALQRWARGLGLREDLTFAMQVAVGEATTNAIQHAYGATPGPVRLRARTDGELLRVEVEDRGRWRPERPGAEGVHGFAMMRALSEAVDVETTEHGTTVRLAFSAARAPAALDEPLM